MTEKEKQNKLRVIKQTLQSFPKIVKQDVERGKAHQKLMKAFEPMAKDLARRVMSKKIST